MSHGARASVVLFSVLIATEARGQGLLVPTTTGRPDASILSLREMAIDIGLARGYARVNVRQVYENHTGSVQEGTYRFRLPPSAAVGDFAVWDGLARIPGVILEKQRARAIYRELTTQRIDPGLLQQGEEEDRPVGTGPGPGAPSGGAAFSVRVSPIPAWSTKRLELQFQQEVPFVEGHGEFRLGLRPAEGEPPVAGMLVVRARVEDAAAQPAPDSYPLIKEGPELVFTGSRAALDRDLVIRLTPLDATPLRLTAFRNPEGTLPGGLALAPWERASEIPPEKDGVFLLELEPPASPAAARPGEQPMRAPVSIGILFDTSLSHRWAGLEAAYGHLVRILAALGPKDRFVLVPFDRRPATGVALRAATPDAVESALGALRARPLSPGTDVALALAEARSLVGDLGRLLLLSDAAGKLASKTLAAGRGPLPLFSVLTGDEAPEALRAVSTQLLAPGATEVEADLFFKRVLGPLEKAPRAKPEPEPFSVSGGEPRLREVYPVLLQPPAAGSLSGWVGRYELPQPRLRWELASPLLEGGRGALEQGLPEAALEARDLPRRWGRARVDHLLLRIEADGERREWVDEIIALSKRYKFVTPYTAFLAAPRALLRPRRIQPGDPVLRVECDPGTVSAVALFPFGLRLPLVRRPGTRLWEGRFLVPDGLEDGRYSVRILLRDRGGATVSESKHFVLDGRAPVIRPELPLQVRPGAVVSVAARTDADVVVLSARLGAGAPVPLRWDASARRSVARLPVPASLTGRQEVLFEAVDGAHNHGYARAVMEVRP